MLAITREFDYSETVFVHTSEKAGTERHFLRYLEGPRHALDFIYRRAAEDARHRNVAILLAERIGRRSFSPGTMSYAGIRTELLDLKHHYGADDFDPNRFSVSMIRELAGLFRASIGGRSARS